MEMIDAVSLRIASAPDVDAVLALQWIGATRFAYWIRTPFEFPKFAIGVFDSATDCAQLLSSCGLYDTAFRRWQQLHFPEISQTKECP